MSNYKNSRLAEIIKWVITIAFAAFCAVLVYAKFRYPPRYVETGSMLPDYQIGAIVWIDEKAYENNLPAIGDVAAYETGSRTVMHRIIEDNGDGTYVFKGDNNDSEDFSAVSENQIIGKAVFHTNLLAPIIRALHHLSSV